MSSAKFFLLLLFAIALVQTVTSCPSKGSETVSAIQNSTIHCKVDDHCPRLSLCYKTNCICRMGYQWQESSGECIRHMCTTDYDCYHYYPHTKCVNDACVCDDMSRFCPINQACVYLPNSFNYMMAIFVMAAIFLVLSITGSLITFWWTKRKYQKTEQGSLVQNASTNTNYRTANGH